MRGGYRHVEKIEKSGGLFVRKTRNEQGVVASARLWVNDRLFAIVFDILMMTPAGHFQVNHLF